MNDAIRFLQDFAIRNNVEVEVLHDPAKGGVIVRWSMKGGFVNICEVDSEALTSGYPYAIASALTKGYDEMVRRMNSGVCI